MCLGPPIDLVAIGERPETLEYWIGPTSDSSDGEPDHQGGCGSINTADDGLEIGMGCVGLQLAESLALIIANQDQN
jgi:hypothetical protein